MTARTRNIIIVSVAVGIVSGLLAAGMLAGVAVKAYRAAVRAGNEAATVQNVKTIAAIEGRYFFDHQRSYGTFAQLHADAGLNAKFNRNPTFVDGYVFTLTLLPEAGRSSWYKLTADPQDTSTGRDHFYIDSTDHRIRVNSKGPAGPIDRFLE